MRYQHSNVARLLCLLLLPMFGGSVLANTFRLTDQHGQPVADAVITAEVAEVEASDPETVAVMDQVDSQFLPTVLVVEKGQKVSFPNSDNIRHHVYSFSKPNDFEIKLYSGEPTEPVQFESPGLVVLGCNIHDRMKGYIYVSDGKPAVVTDASGQATLEAGAIDSVEVWHSQLSGGIDTRVRLPLLERDGQGRWLLNLNLKAQDSVRKSKFRERYK